MQKTIISLVAILLVLGGCDLPRDPDGTSQRVRGDEIVVGRIAGAPLPRNERRAIDNLAATFDATVRYVDDDAHRLFALLETHEIDLIAGDLPEDTPFSRMAGFSNPVGSTQIGGETKRTVLAVPRGENAFLVSVNRQIAAGER